MDFKRLLATFVLMFFALSNIAVSGTFYVDTNGDNDPDTCVEDESDNDDDCTLRDAISQVTDGDVIQFLEDTIITAASGYTLGTDNVTLDGSTGGYNVEIDAAAAIAITGSGVTVQGLEIYGSGNDGITINGANATVSNNEIGLNDDVIDANTDYGVAIDAAGATVSNNVISGNASGGIELLGGAIDATISGNYIGTDTAGTTDKGNAADGIRVSEDLDFDGGDDAGGITITGNTIAGNSSHGINFSHGGTTLSGIATISNNKIGVGSDGSTKIANDLMGLTGGTEVAGVTFSITGNTISGNGQSGINLTDGVSATVTGNYIGLTSAGEDNNVGNTSSGMVLDAITNVVSDNYVGDNGGDAIKIDDAVDPDATSATFDGNIIGYESDGTTASGNGGQGIVINSANLTTVTIGGNDTADGNTIGNGSTGINIQNTAATATVTIKNNKIGITGSGGLLNTDAGNSSSGMSVADGQTVNITNNFISNNGDDGITTPGGISFTIQGNIIGAACASAPCTITDVSNFTTAAGNTNSGIEIDSSSATSVTIGGSSDSNLGNLIASNGGDGIDINDLATNSTAVTIEGNQIGVNGSTDMGNTNEGIISLEGDLTIGGTDSGEGNVISGNGSYGIHVKTNTTGLKLYANKIGVSQAGTAAVTNDSGGVQINDPSALADLTIGGATSSFRNIISGNTGHGLLMGSGATISDASVVIQNNYIGTDVNGTTDLGNTGRGVYIQSGNTATLEDNIISGNGSYGVQADTSSSNNVTLLDNYIGVGATGLKMANDSGGVNIATGTLSMGDDTVDNVNVVSGNTGAGLSISGDADVTVNESYFGTNTAGSAVEDGGATALGNGSVALAGVFNEGGINIGTDASGTISITNSVISGNYGQGILILGSADTTISNNKIGTDVNGTTDLGNINGSSGYDLDNTGSAVRGDIANGSGVLITDAGGGTTTIGVDVNNNVISGNSGAGIAVIKNSKVLAGDGINFTGGGITSNNLGVAADGSTQMDNDSYNIYIDENDTTISNITIGGSGNENTINNNNRDGIYLADAGLSNFTGIASLNDLDNNVGNTFLNVCETGTDKYWWSRYVADVIAEFSPDCSTSGGGGGDFSGPVSPTSLSSVSNDTSVTVTWNDPYNSDLQRLEVIRSVNGGPYSIYATVGTNVETYTDTNVSDGNTYQYRVRGYDTSNNRGTNSNIVTEEIGESSSSLNDSIQTNITSDDDSEDTTEDTAEYTTEDTTSPADESSNDSSESTTDSTSNESTSTPSLSNDSSASFIRRFVEPFRSLSDEEIEALEESSLEERYEIIIKDRISTLANYNPELDPDVDTDTKSNTSISVDKKPKTLGSDGDAYNVTGYNSDGVFLDYEAFPVTKQKPSGKFKVADVPVEEDLLPTEHPSCTTGKKYEVFQRDGDLTMPSVLKYAYMPNHNSQYAVVNKPNNKSCDAYVVVEMPNEEDETPLKIERDPADNFDIEERYEVSLKEDNIENKEIKAFKVPEDDSDTDAVTNPEITPSCQTGENYNIRKPNGLITMPSVFTNAYIKPSVDEIYAVVVESKDGCNNYKIVSIPKDIDPDLEIEFEDVENPQEVEFIDQLIEELDSNEVSGSETRIVFEDDGKIIEISPQTKLRVAVTRENEKEYEAEILNNDDPYDDDTIVIGPGTTVNNVDVFLAADIGLCLNSNDCDNDGLSNVDEFWLDSDPTVTNETPTDFTVTNLLSGPKKVIKVAGGLPVFRMWGLPMNDPFIYLYDIERGGEAIISSDLVETVAAVDEGRENITGDEATKYKEVAIPQFPLDDGLYLITVYNDRGVGTTWKMIVDNSYDLDPVEFSVEDADGTAEPVEDGGETDLNVSSDEIVIKGKPNSIVHLTWKSVTKSSVVLLDSNGESVASVPREVIASGEIDHEVFAYILDEENGVMSSVARMFLRISQQ